MSITYRLAQMFRGLMRAEDTWLVIKGSVTPTLPPNLPECCPRANCGALLGTWQPHARGLMLRRCTRCSYRESVLDNVVEWRRRKEDAGHVPASE